MSNLLDGALRTQPKASRSKSWPELFGDLVAALAEVLIEGLVIMAVLHVLHDHLPAVPALGYWESALVFLAAKAVGSTFHPSK